MITTPHQSDLTRAIQVALKLSQQRDAGYSTERPASAGVGAGVSDANLAESLAAEWTRLFHGAKWSTWNEQRIDIRERWLAFLGFARSLLAPSASREVLMTLLAPSLLLPETAGAIADVVMAAIGLAPSAPAADAKMVEELAKLLFDGDILKDCLGAYSAAYAKGACHRIAAAAIAHIGQALAKAELTSTNWQTSYDKACRERDEQRARADDMQAEKNRQMRRADEAVVERDQARAELEAKLAARREALEESEIEAILLRHFPDATPVHPAANVAREAAEKQRGKGAKAT